MYKGAKLSKDKDRPLIVREISKEVPIPWDEQTENEIQEMIKHIDYSQDPNQNDVRPGVGIAACQIGVLKRMFYINLNGYEEQGVDDFKEFLINPKIVAYGARDAALSMGEGCLSVDEKGREKQLDGLVHRKYKVVVEGYSYFQKKKVSITKTGYPAIVLQHEMDHQDGKLFYDRINLKKPHDKKTEDEEIIM